MDPDRVLAAKLLIECIDRHPGKYIGKDAQDDVFAMLANKHQLKWRMQRNNARIPLNKHGYRMLMQEAAKSIVPQTKHGERRLQKLFENGSKIVKKEFLRSNGYARPKPLTENEDSDDENDAVYEGEDEQEDAEWQEGDEHSEATGIPATNDASAGVDGRKSGVLEAQNAQTQLANSTSTQLVTGAATQSKKRDSSSVAANEMNPKKKQKIDLTDSPPTSSKNKTQALPAMQTGANLTEKAGKESVSSSVTTKQASRLVKLSDDRIGEALRAIWNKIQAFARTVLDQRQTAQPAALVMNPGPELLKLYQTLFGADWQQRGRTLIQSNMLNARNMIEACTGATVCEVLKSPGLPWQSPDELLEVIGEKAKHINQILREYSDSLDLETLVWQAASNEISDEDFQRQSIQPEAERLANSFMLTLDPQLRALGVAGKGNLKAYWDQRTKEVMKLFEEALDLKGKIRAAPDGYTVCFAEPDHRIIPGQIEEIRVGKGQQLAAFGVMPAIVKRETPDASPKVACQALAYSWPSDGGAQDERD